MAQRSIAQKADILGTFRHVSVCLMETLARWTPLTPELELKVLFGRHIWEFAQHADALGQRASELRAGQHYTRPPIEAYRRALDEYAAFEASGDRVQVVYDVLIPDLARRYQTCLEEADPLLDQPTTRVMERIQHDLARLQAERREMLAEVTVPVQAPEWVGRLQERLAASAEFTDFRPAKEATA